MRFYKTPKLLKKIFPNFIWEIANDHKKIYLTFDDGPIPNVTEFVLKMLEEFNARATFFCVGDNIRKHRDIFNEILKANHWVGNHTFNHLKGWSTANAAYLENIALCQEIIIENLPSSTSTQLFRPPYGRIKNSQYQLIKDDYKIIMWDVLTNDYDQSLDEQVCLEKATQYTQSGSIVVFHDSLKAEKNLRYVLPRYLERMSAQGYTFEAIAL